MSDHDGAKLTSAKVILFMRWDTGPSAGAAMVLFDQPQLILFLMSPLGLGDWVNAVVSDFRLISQSF